ncbi:hypothetical protein [Roseofilum casamattae]|uniref:Antitoxin n=1 Tax=Roseofilum casamattae BLCC-M143 TaxID=3022442 RepID=A0ABT7BSM4_9CYAN|nr:hypothetical protein [Roseofilum casamattae]MDJ1182189.1 hypothetical protein [Roseofilum casamattae BLCC-M143]
MSNYTIALSEQTYQSLLEVARKQGLTPEDWIAAQLPRPQQEPQPLLEKNRDLIGAIDSGIQLFSGDKIARKRDRAALLSKDNPWQVMFEALQEFPEDLQIERDRSLPIEREPII